jgi:SNF2 family DNA or RNA helicase
MISCLDNDKNALDISNDSSSDTCIKNIIFRLRRICNHPLLYKGYYSSDQRKVYFTVVMRCDD